MIAPKFMPGDFVTWDTTNKVVYFVDSLGQEFMIAPSVKKSPVWKILSTVPVSQYIAASGRIWSGSEDYNLCTLKARKGVPHMIAESFLTLCSKQAW